ncbi:uncharacterized protein LOC133491828 [Syngnathoides biaculeatus]|uniref:uncharacterized protein LOC133491828 n=1 Tax=Syngnathoides biaculeatus TaxID=300417 RepID=UPI002ADE522F|nr:uncharacterized protein LOC133491828 [Syngnathoides biaculeatus]
MDGPDAAGGAQKSSGKTVKVVRKVVRRVVPTATQEQNQTSEVPKVTAGLKAPKSSGDDKDDISMGLTSLMGRGRTKEHRTRTRNQDRKEDMTELKQEDLKGEEENVEITEDSTSTAALKGGSPNTAAPNSNPLTPPYSFIPSPKPELLAPPAGFISASKQNLLTAPPGFIPVKRSSPIPLKHNFLARPAGFIPAPKADPLAPPAGFIPKPRPLAVKKFVVQSERTARLSLNP